MSTVQDPSLFKSLPDLKTICNISEQRGKELLEATNGSLERAVDLHFFSNPAGDRDVTLSLKTEDDTGKSKKRLNTSMSSTESPKRRLIGAWYGTGRKAERNFLSPVLLAVYDEDEDVYRSICRCMTFTDKMYTAMRDFYLQGVPYPAELSSDPLENDKIVSQSTKNEDRSLQEAPSENEVACADSSDNELLDFESNNCFANRPSSAFVVTNEQPPIWFRPLEVWEVSYADMSLSRQHTAGAGIVTDSDGRGISLRFPRFKRRRPDRRPDQATTSSQIAAMFLNQAKQMKSSA